PRRAQSLVVGPDAAVREGMGAVVDLHEPVHAHVGVALGGREARVAEQLLDPTEIGARVEQVRGAGVAERVRMQVASPGAERAVPPYDVLDLPDPEGRAVAAEEERARVLPPRPGAAQIRPLGEIVRERLGRGTAERREPLLVPLADHTDL